MSIVKIDNLEYFINRHKKSLVILKDISYKIKDGEIHLISGPSGSGKTTFLQLIASFLEPTAGKLQLFDKEIYPTRNREDINFIRSKIGYLYQTPYLPDNLKIKDYLEIQALLSGLGTRTAQKRIAELLKEFEMIDFASKSPKTLSGGEKQRIAIIGVLAKQVDLILMDEPTGSLDYKSKTELVNMIHQLKKQSITTIIVSHDQEVFEDLIDEKYYLKNKTICTNQ